MISKELLSEVLDLKKEVMSIAIRENNIIPCNQGIPIATPINIYELAHKCKEWALKSSYQLHSAMRNGNLPIVVLIDEQDVLRHYFKADTEPEVIFKACEWLLENKTEKDYNENN
jgi:hypothetical protein